MAPVRSLVLTLLIAAGLGLPAPARAQSNEPLVEIVVSAGRPIRIALDSTVTARHVGQRVTGTLVDDVYAYDRVVLSAGALVSGHIEGFVPPSTLTRVHAMLGGDFSPNSL